MKTLAAFLGGALVGTAAALLFAPQSGEDTRSLIREVLRKYGLLKPAEEDELIEQIVAEVEASQKK